MYEPFVKSDRAQRTQNPIRNFVEKKLLQANKTLGQFPDRPAVQVDVSIGDPCVYGDFRPHPSVLEAVSETVDKNNGYVDFEGIRVAI